MPLKFKHFPIGSVIGSEGYVFRHFGVQAPIPSYSYITPIDPVSFPVLTGYSLIVLKGDMTFNAANGNRLWTSTWDGHDQLVDLPADTLIFADLYEYANTSLTATPNKTFSINRTSGKLNGNLILCDDDVAPEGSLTTMRNEWNSYLAAHNMTLLIAGADDGSVWKPAIRSTDNATGYWDGADGFCAVHGGIPNIEAQSIYKPIIPTDVETYPQFKYEDSVLSFAVRTDVEYGYYTPKTNTFAAVSGMTGTDMPTKRDGYLWQYFNNWNSSLFTARTQNGVVVSVYDDDSMGFTGTATSSTFQIVGPPELSIAGHVYALFGNFSVKVTVGSNGINIGLRNGAGFIGCGERGGKISTITDGYTTGSLVFRIANGYEIPDGFTAKPDIFDLTAMFGDGNEPRNLTELESAFEGFYHVDAGTTLTLGGNPFSPVEPDEPDSTDE